jgi:hypothetical protein
LFEAFPDLRVRDIVAYASGLGPAATYTLTMTVGDDPCLMGPGTVWDLDRLARDQDEQALVVDEYVYYDPKTVLDCGGRPSAEPTLGVPTPAGAPDTGSGTRRISGVDAGAPRIASFDAYGRETWSQLLREGGPWTP